MPNETTPNILEMSDEEISNMSAPPAVTPAGEGEDGSAGSDDPNKGAGDAGQDGGDAGTGDEGEDGEGEGTGEGEGEDAGTGEGEGEDNPDKKDPKDKKDGKDTPSGESDEEGGNLAAKDKSQGQDGKPTGKTTPPAKDGKGGKDGQDNGKSGDGAAPAGSKPDGAADTPPDYKALYEALMQPLKANGKIIELKSPEELKQLAQMGANYTRKMQAIAPHRKILLMLENNGLLDEGKLSFLIDIEKKNPDAIKQLIKDAGLDPREIDLEDPQAKPYLVGNHRVAEEEVAFRTVLDDVSSNPGGKETLLTINTQWDQASKEVLWKQPEVMSLIHQQRENGIYDRISNEVERLKNLGTIPSQTPFLAAYKQVGDQLAEAGAFDDLIKPKVETQKQSSDSQKTPVATRTGTPKPVVKNGDKVSAASPTRSSTRKAEAVINPLSLSDEEFEKQFAQYQGRV